MKKELALNVHLDEEQERQLEEIRRYYNARGYININTADIEMMAVSLLQVAIKEEYDRIMREKE